MTNPTDAERALTEDAIYVWHGSARIVPWAPELINRVSAALASARTEGYRRGQEETLKQADEIFGMLWVDLFNSDQVKASAADQFDFRRSQLRALPNHRPPTMPSEPMPTVSEEEAWRKVLLLATCESLSIDGYKNTLAAIRGIALNARAALQAAAAVRQKQE